MKWLMKKLEQLICPHRMRTYKGEKKVTRYTHYIATLQQLIFGCTDCGYISSSWYTHDKYTCHTGEHLMTECPGDHGK